MGPLRPKQPSHHVAGYLATNEHVVLEMKQHWARVLPAITSCVLGFFLVLVAGVMAPASLGFLTNAAWWIWLVLLAHLAWRVLEWWDETFVITNKRLILVHGLFVKKVAMMPLSKVTDMSYNRSPAARILGYGTFVMESAGQDQALDVVDYVRDPDGIYRTLCGLIFGADEPAQHEGDVAAPTARDGIDDEWDEDVDEVWSEAWDDVDDTETTQPLPTRRSSNTTRRASDRLDLRDDDGAPGAPHALGEDDTDPYGLVTVTPIRGRSTSSSPYSQRTSDIEESQVSDEDAAWSVSREHATTPQPVRRYHDADSLFTSRDNT